MSDKTVMRNRISWLPVELWIEVLEWAIRPRFALESRCRAEHIDYYNKAISIPLSMNKEYDESTQQRRTLTCVCKLWRNILIELPSLWVAQSTSNKPYIPSYSIRRLDIAFHDWEAKISHASSSTTVLHITFPGDPNFKSELLENLGKSTCAMKQIRVFHFTNMLGSGTHAALSSLHLNFQHIETLSLNLNYWGSFPALRLDGLRTLLLKGWAGMPSRGIENWHFPLLECLSIEGQIDVLSISLRSFLLSHAEGLLSLCMRTRLLYSLITWERFRRLECLTGLFCDGPPLPPLPSWHPLRRLIFHDHLSPGTLSMLNLALRDIIPSQLTHIGCSVAPITNQEYWTSPLRAGVSRLDARLTKNKIVLTDSVTGTRMGSLGEMFGMPPSRPKKSGWRSLF